ncbi:3-deoxy-7-phosphoheptulonate synthase [Tropicibacter sp. R15_0]|uniref:3-deoxy-7-phosphoheptulonate synthase n=1 Tax=Tropicibacter sp. R15_0 TaxID=2821101 RepID=UPI001ADB3730|nr:3-deoxy-7-phosphoheptulonate synthase [Tropicibacter sp. R15_0]MBO9465857.1 3-deoxy-7-phosphoheptulonate synthase [Tropicibacter sp. R15_0]
MPIKTQNLRVAKMQELTTPAELRAQLPISEAASLTVEGGRNAIQRILKGEDDRMIAVTGPCSIHDTEAALDYARKLQALRVECADTLEIVMRVYFEKPRTIGGWKGLINDPFLDGSFAINDGLLAARELLLEINEMGLPVGTEFLDTAVPQYVADLVSWAAIGARTTESQIHREMASGLSCPVGFKNGTRGNIQIAIDAVRSSAQPHHFMGLSEGGQAAIVGTSGNPDCHVILRGGEGTNYDEASVDTFCYTAEKDGIRPQVMIDASHANSGKLPERQPEVLANVGGQIARGDHRIMGVMVESNLVAGAQKLGGEGPLVYGQSITDGCIDWATTQDCLRELSDNVRQRRGALTRKAG